MKENACVFSFIAFVVGLAIFSYWPAVKWPQERRAELRAAEKQDRLANEIDVDEYKMVWSWREHKSDIPRVKDKYETIQLLKSNAGSQ